MESEKYVPKSGDLRVWWNRFDSEGTQYYRVPSLEVAVGVLNGLAFADLDNPRVEVNSGGLEVYEDNGEGFDWYEWYDEEEGRELNGWADDTGIYVERLG